MITVKGLAKSFYDNHVLKGIDFEIKAGKFYTLIGENGAGKSTIMKTLIGLETIDNGTVTIFGRSAKGFSQEHKYQIGYVSENIDYDVPMSVREFSKRYGELYPTWDDEYFLKLVADRQLDIDKKFSLYSRGQKMQIALILALATRPKLLMIDEVTAMLDIYARKYFLNIMTDFVNDGGTVLITTNIITEVQQYTTDLLLIDDGDIKINSPIDEIPQKFKKLRKTSENKDNAVFKDRNCVWSGTNSDNSDSYIIPLQAFKKYEMPPGAAQEMMDRRKVMLDDIFVYYFNFKEGHETAL